MAQYNTSIPIERPHVLLIERRQVVHLVTAVKGVSERAGVLQEHFGFRPENIITLGKGQATHRIRQVLRSVYL